MHRAPRYGSHLAPTPIPMVSRKLVAASSAPLLLSILARGESYGYAIIQDVLALSSGRIEWTEGMLYPVLHRMQEEGWIEAEWRNSESGRKRKYYRLAPKGETALERERDEWTAVNTALEGLWGGEPCTT